MGEHYLVEAALENMEAVVDAVAQNELVKSIPVVGTAAKLLKAVGSFRDKIFAAKLTRFLRALDETTPEAREKIRQKIACNPDEAKEVGERLLLVLDKITTLDKAQIIAYLFIAYTLGHIGPTDFLRLSDAIDQAFVDDLTDLLDGQSEHQKSQLPFMAYLSRTGLTTIVAGQSWDDAGEIYYTVSPLGVRFIHAYSEARKYCGGSTKTPKAQTGH